MRILASIALGSLALAGCAAEPQQEAPEAEQAQAEPAVETLPAEELAALIESGEVLLIDVRTPYEFADARIEGALNAPLTHFDAAAIPMEDGRETILYCGSSRRSGIAAEQLAEHIGGTVRHLEGGITAWQEAGLETVANDPSDDPREG